jgi:hypothetical protein
MEFRPRTIGSLLNAFTSAFKELDPVPPFKATSKLGEFLEARFSQSFYQRAALSFLSVACTPRRISPRRCSVSDHDDAGEA